MSKNADLKRDYETLWKEYTKSNYDRKLALFKEAILTSMELCRRNEIENPRILFEFLLDL